MSSLGAGLDQVRAVHECVLGEVEGLEGMALRVLHEWGPRTGHTSLTGSRQAFSPQPAALAAGRAEGPRSEVFREKNFDDSSPRQAASALQSHLACLTPRALGPSG